MNDLISRQAAIGTLMEFDKKLRKINWYQYPYTEYECIGVDKAIVKIANLPSAQPEPLTDKEQRIFLAAMSREEKVCKQVDDECRNCREPYEDSLVRICHEITRKVKGALWET